MYQEHGVRLCGYGWAQILRHPQVLKVREGDGMDGLARPQNAGLGLSCGGNCGSERLVEDGGRRLLTASFRKQYGTRPSDRLYGEAHRGALAR